MLMLLLIGEGRLADDDLSVLLLSLVWGLGLRREAPLGQRVEDEQFVNGYGGSSAM